MDKKKKLLICSCGTNAAYHTIKTLKEKFGGNFYIIGIDINERCWIPCSSYLDAFYTVPPTVDSSYYQIVLKICTNEHIDFIIPIYDADQQAFYPENPDLIKLGIVSFGTKSNTLSFYKDKLSMFDKLKDGGLPIPRCYQCKDIVDDELYFIKPINGVASIGVRKIKGIDIKRLATREKYIIQEICETPEITLECFHYGNRISSIARERHAVKSGVCTKARIFHSQELEQIAKLFVKKINPPLYFNLQFMKSQKGYNVITDVNLRLAGGMSMSHAVGWDEVSSIANYMLGADVDTIFSSLRTITQEKKVVRVYEDIVTTDAGKRIVFDLDGTLLDSRMRHKVVLNDILSQQGIHLDLSDYIDFKRNGYTNKTYLTSKGLQHNTIDTINTEWINHIEDYEYLQLDKLYANIECLLKQHKHISFYLLTARQNPRNALRQLDELGIHECFSDVIIVNPTANVAEQKTNFLKKLSPDMYIGDTELDYLAAINANVNHLLTNNGFRSESFLKKFSFNIHTTDRISWESIEEHLSIKNAEQ